MQRASILLHEQIIVFLGDLAPDVLHDPGHCSRGLLLAAVEEREVFSGDPLEAGLAPPESFQVPHVLLVGLETAGEGAARDELRPEVHGHFVPAQGLELVLALVRVPQLLPQTFPQFLQGLRRGEVVPWLLLLLLLAGTGFRDRICDQLNVHATIVGVHSEGLQLVQDVI